jgi:hypothetical protein
MEGLNLKEQEKKFTSPEEEIQFLREQIAQREQIIEQEGQKIESEAERDGHIKNTLEEYQKNQPEEVMEKGTVVPETVRNEIVLKLNPEEHDNKMAELIGMVESNGIINVLDVVKKMDNPHIYDDFHRFLVQYLKEGYDLPGLKDKSPLSRALGRTLFEVALTKDRNDEGKKQLGEVIGLMEQFYSGMLSVSSGEFDDYLTLEISNSVGSQQFIFYISVSDSKKDLLEKQLLSVFPDAQLSEQTDDFNIFVPNGYSVGSYVTLDTTPAKPIKLADEYKSDPLKVILNVFSKLDKEENAAAIQMVFKPVGGFYDKNYSKALSKVEKGEKSDELYIKNTRSDKIVRGVGKFIGSIGSVTSSSSSKPDENEPYKPATIDNNLVEQIRNKLKSPIVSTNIRIVSSAKDATTAEKIMEDIKSSFNQFNDPVSNRFKFSSLKQSAQKALFNKFTYREFDQAYDTPLNLSEISTILHFPEDMADLSPQLKTNKSTTAPAPMDLSNEGIQLGINKNRGIETDVHFAPEDRLRHFYTIGQTGTGKTNFMKSMIIQDIQNGDGVCMIDPHGSDIQDVLANIPPERHEDVIYFDPANIDRPMALNMLEYDPAFPEQKTFVVNELFGIFMKLYGSNPESMGPMFEQYFRNATQLVIEDPETGSTLLDVSRVLADAEFRKLKLSKCKNPIVKQFWEEIAGKAGGEASLQNIVPYITSKFDVFLANDIMRPVVAQEKSSFNFRKIMDEKKILLVNLSKGRLGDINSNLIGLILVGKILMAALSRVDSAGSNKEMPTFYLYIDEFQNITTDSIATILSEARKYKLSLNIAHQFIAQLDPKIKDAVFGNVGSLGVFRVGSEDAEFLQTQFAPIFSASDIMNIDNYNCYLKMLVNGVPTDPFNIKTLKSPDGNPEQVAQLKELSAQKYGRDKKEVDASIDAKYFKKEEHPVGGPDSNNGAGKSDRKNPFADLNV